MRCFSSFIQPVEFLLHQMNTKVACEHKKVCEIDVVRELIECYRNLPCLWDVTDPNYMDRGSRRKGYQTLLKIYRKIKPDTTMPLLKRKIEHLRGSYRREQKRASVRYNRPNGEYKPRLWYYELMGFLDKIAKRPDREFDDCILSNDEEPWTPSPRSPTPGHPHKEQKTDDHGQLGLRSSTKNAAEDRDLMGRSLAAQLKKLMPHQRVVANKLISDIVFYGNLGKLSENSAVIVSRPLVHDQVTTPPNAQLPLMTSVQDLQKLLKVGSMRADGEISDEEVTVEDAMEDYPTIQIENGMIHPIKEEEEEDSFGS